MAVAVCRARWSSAQPVILIVVVVLGFFYMRLLYQSFAAQPGRVSDTFHEEGAEIHQTPRGSSAGSGTPVLLHVLGSDKRAVLRELGVYFSRNETHWLRKPCDPERKFRAASIVTGIGNLTFYIYDNGFVDTSVSERALHGEMFERYEIERFLLISKHLPLIDVGANVGLVTLQAALQGRQVLALEPIPENALRLCRSAVDFGLSSLVHVVNNAASSWEGRITMAMDIPRHVAHFEVSRGRDWGYGATASFSILMDRLLEVIPFKQAALKIDVERHEGFVMAGARRLFQEIDIPLVWMEWEFVKKMSGPYGPLPILQFMREHSMEPRDLMTGKPLGGTDFTHWPFTVLWVRAGVDIE